MQTDSTRRFLKDKEAQHAFENTTQLSTINPGDYGAVFYPGGHGPLSDLAEDHHSIKIIEALFTAGKPVERSATDRQSSATRKARMARFSSKENP